MKKVVTLFLSFSLLGILAACSKDSGFTIPDYNYTNPPITSDDWRDLETDAGMKIDANFDEPQYNSINPFSFKAGNGSEYEMKITNYMGAKGIYVKAEIKDDTLYYNTARPVWQNSSLVLYFSPYVAGQTPILNENTVQARIGINGYTEQWMGKKSADGYPYSRIYAPMIARVKILNGSTEVKYDKNKDISLDTGVTGYNMEVFVPYETIGLSGKPDSYLVLPEFNKCTAYEGENARTMFQPVGMSYDNPSSFGAFDSVGYLKKGAVNGLYLGSGQSNATLGWDVKKDNMLEKTVMQKAGYDQKIYFKDMYATKYKIDTFVTVNQVLNNDGYPKFGLIAAENDANTYCFFVDPLKALTNKWVLAVDKNSNGTNWNWGAGMSEFPQVGFTEDKKIKLTAIRDGKDFYFLVNDKIAGMRTDIRGFEENALSHAGFMTMNMAATFVGYSVITEEATVQSAINQIKNLSIDGDLSNWTDTEKMYSKQVYGINEFTSQGFTVYSKYIKGDGLYVGGNASHRTEVTDKGEWWQNTNFEIFVNGNNQKWLINGNNSGLYGVYKSTKVNEHFNTTFECYIPEESIQSLNKDNNYIRLGFAFKAPGENIVIENRDSGNATDWWWENGHYPSNNDEQYFVYSDGIFNARK